MALWFNLLVKLTRKEFTVPPFVNGKVKYYGINVKAVFERLSNLDIPHDGTPTLAGDEEFFMREREQHQELSKIMCSTNIGRFDGALEASGRIGCQESQDVALSCLSLT